MAVKSFGFNKKGEEVFLYTIANDNIELSVTNYGATMVSLIEKKTGIDVLLGYVVACNIDIGCSLAHCCWLLYWLLM